LSIKIQALFSEWEEPVTAVKKQVVIYLKINNYFTSFFAHIVFKLIRLIVFGLLSTVEGLKEAASTRA